MAPCRRCRYVGQYTFSTDERHAALRAGHHVDAGLLFESLGPCLFCACGRSMLSILSFEKSARRGELGVDISAGAETVMTNADEASRQYMQKEAPQELACLERHALLLTAIGVIS